MNITPRDLMNVWNVNRGEMLACASIDIKNRFKFAEARINDVPDLLRWVSAIKRAAKSNFCTGMIPNEKGEPFIGSFDWIMRPETIILIEEGHFDNRGPVEVVPPDTPSPKDLSYFNDPKPQFTLSDKEIMDAQVNGLLKSYSIKRKRAYAAMTRAELEETVTRLRKTGELWTPNRVRSIIGHAK